MTWVLATGVRATATAAVTAVALIAVSAQAPATPAEVTMVLTDLAHFTGDELALLESGQVISRTETFPDLFEASVVAAVKIRSQKERTVAYFKTLISYVDGQVTTGYGTFNRPPSENDLRTLTIEPTDVSDLQACLPGDCAIRLRAAAPNATPPPIDWSAPDSTVKANAWVRQQLAAYVADYNARGNAALVAFDDQSKPINLVEQWQALADRSPIVSTLAPHLHRYATSHPGAVTSGMNEEIYWDHQHYVGLKPMIDVTQLVSYTDPARPERTLLLQKQIYASHYLSGSLALTLLLETTTAQGPVTYVVYVNRARGDLFKAGQTQAPPPAQTTNRGGLSGALNGLRAGLNSLGGTLQRRMGEQMIRSSAVQLLGSMKEALER